MSNTDFILIIFGSLSTIFLIAHLFLLNRIASLLDTFVADAKTRVVAHNRAVADGIVASPQTDALTPGLLRFSPEEIDKADAVRDKRMRQAQRTPFKDGEDGF